MAKSLEISTASGVAVVHDDLKLKSYKLCKNHYLNETMKANRFKINKVLLKRSSEGRHRLVLITDEKVFPVEQHHNHQNDRQLLSATSKQRGSVSRSHHPASVMVWAGITHTGKTPLVFIDNGVKVNQAQC